MNAFCKIISVFLLIVLINSMGFTMSVSADDFLATYYEKQNYVAVSGNVGETYAGAMADVMIVSSDAYDITKEDILYIAQTKIDSLGSYSFEAQLDFEIGKTLDDYKVILNINGDKIEKSLSETAVISELVNFKLDFSEFGKAIAKTENTYNLTGLKYKIIISFYSEDNVLIGIKHIHKYTGDSQETLYSYSDIPAGAVYAKGFLWEDIDSIYPLSMNGVFDIKGYTENRTAQFLTIAPGSDETERNFNWYDIAGVEGVKIQYAIAENEQDKLIFPEKNAIVADAEYGVVDARKHDGTLWHDGNGDKTFRYSHDYSWAKATISGLQPGKTYVYRIGDKLGWLNGIYTFKTDFDPKEEFNFIVLTDEHATPLSVGAKEAMTNSRAKALEACSDASFVLTTGDNVDFPWLETAYYDYFNREGMTSYPLAAIPGPTHDMMQKLQSASLFGYHFNMPNQTSDKGYISGVAGNYWYTYGDVLFIGIVIPNNGGTNAKNTQKAFIEDAVSKNPDTKWRILFTHQPYYYSTKSYVGLYYNDPDFISDNKIDVVFTGHDHCYRRTHQMKSDVAYPELDDTPNEVTNPTGTVFFTLNTAGMLCGQTSKNNNHDAFVDSTLNGAQYGANLAEGYYATHYTIVSLKGDTLTINTYQNKCNAPKGENPNVITETSLLDSYKITKTN